MAGNTLAKRVGSQPMGPALVPVGVLALVALSIWAYRGVMLNGFVWDTTYYLQGHQQQIAGLGLKHLNWMLTSLAEANWHPLTWLSFAIDYQLYGGLNPAGFHLSNAVLHGLDSGLVFLCVLALFGIRSRPDGPMLAQADLATYFACFFGAVLFALHPQHVESVAWVAERKDVLCLFFMLLTVLAYLKYAVSSGSAKRDWYLAAVLFAVLAAMSKPLAVSLPVVLLLLDVYPLDRWPSNPANERPRESLVQILGDKIPFVVISLALAWLTLMAQQEAMTSVPLSIRVLNAFNSVMAYLAKWAVPVGLSPHYPYFTNPQLGIRMVHFLPVLGFAGISTLAAYAWARGNRAVLVAWLFYLVTLFPMLGLVSVGLQGMADRYAYLPTLPAYVLVAAGLLALFRKATAIKALALLAVITVCVGLAAQTARQVSIWRNELSLWSHAVQLHPEDGTARENLGVSLLQVKAFDKALAQFNAIDRLPQKKTINYSWRAYTLLSLGRYEEALADHLRLQASSKNEPGVTIDWDCFHYNLGWLQAQLGQAEAAAEQFGKVGTSSPLSSSAAKWLIFLESVAPGQKPPNAPDLPGFCPALIPEWWSAPGAG